MTHQTCCLGGTGECGVRQDQAEFCSRKSLFTHVSPQSLRECWLAAAQASSKTPDERVSSVGQQNPSKKTPKVDKSNPVMRSFTMFTSLLAIRVAHLLSTD